MLVLTDWLLTPQRLAIHQPSATAVVADLHLGYHQARRQSGEAVPLADLDDILLPLWKVVQEHRVGQLVIAGDLFEKDFCPVLWEKLRSWLNQTGLKLAGLVPGNHDRGLNNPPRELHLFTDGYSLGPWQIVHGDDSLPRGPVVFGHFHPCVRYRGRRCPCYLVGPRALVLPAYSPEAAGVAVWNGSRWRGHRCMAIDEGAIVDLGTVPGKDASQQKSRPWEGRLRRG